MYNKLYAYGIMFFVLLASVLASNIPTFHFYDADGDGITNVEVIAFECTNDTCASITGSEVDSADSGSTNDASLVIPGVLTETTFIFYIFAEESDSYLPHYEKLDVIGDGVTGNFDVTLNKKDICRSTIQSFSVTNSVAPHEPITIDVAAALEADTYSAFQYTNEVYTYGTTEYEDWFSVETDVQLSITKDVYGIDIPVHSDATTLNIIAEESENVEFSWTPETEGTYTATVTTYVNDDQCEDSEEQASSQIFEVVEPRETEYCYTLIDNLAVQEIEDGTVTTLQTGETYTVVFDKISNSVNADGNKATLATDLDIAIYDEDANLDYGFSDTMNANPSTDFYSRYSFSWIPVSEGDNTIVVTGEAVDCPYSENNSETETLTIYVEGVDIETTQAPVAIIDVNGYWSFLPYITTTSYALDFDGSRSYDPDGGSIVSYAWDFGDGSTSTDQDPTLHTYASTGLYTVTLTVIDDEGEIDTDTLNLLIFRFDLNPSVSCNGPYSGTVGEDIIFEGSSTDHDGGTVTFLWDFGDGSTSTDEDPTHAYTAEGTYNVILTVTDDEGNTNSCETQAIISVANTEPTIDCSAIPTSGTTNEPVEMTVTAIDTNDNIMSYEWDFGDGSIDSTSSDLDSDTKTHTYTTANIYTVTVTVTDEEGAYATCTTEIEVTDSVIENTEPIIDCSAIPISGIAGIPLDLEITATDSDGIIVYYIWSFDDGTPDETTITNTNTHTYAAADIYSPEFYAYDDDGDFAFCSVDINISAPTETLTVQIIASTTSGIAPLLVDFTAVVTGGTEPYSYAWDLDGDSIADSTDAAPSFTYIAEGVYVVILVVTDAEGNVESDTEIITVDEDLPAIAVASADPTNGEPTLWVHFSSAGSSGDEPLSYYWTFGDGSSSTDPNPGHYYHEEGTFTATLKVTDSDGDTDTDTVIITVSDDLENIANRHYFIDGIAIENDGRVKAGDDIELYISAENIADYDKDSVAFNAIIQELGIYATTVEMDLDTNEEVAVVLLLEIPEDAKLGTYYVRVTISDDDVKRVIYRDIIIEE